MTHTLVLAGGAAAGIRISAVAAFVILSTGWQRPVLAAMMLTAILLSALLVAAVLAS